MSVGSLVLVLTSIADIVPILSGVGKVADENGPKFVTKAVLLSGVIAIVHAPELTGMSVRCLVFRSIADTVPLPLLTTKPVLPSGVTAPPTGPEPTVMSVGSLVLVFTSIAE